MKEKFSIRHAVIYLIVIVLALSCYRFVAVEPLDDRTDGLPAV